MAAFAVFMALGSGALAQDSPPRATGAPVVLAPPRPLAPPQLKSAPEPAAPNLPAVSPSPDSAITPSGEAEANGIKVDTLGEIDADSVGVLDANSGGFGVDMWSDTSAATVRSLFAQIKHPAALPTARALTRRLLLSAARPPRAMAAPSGRGAAPSLLARRLQLLLALGDVKSAKALLRVVPVRVTEPAVGLVRMQVGFLVNDKNGACDEARAGVANHNGTPWRKAIVFCQYLAGEQSRAAIGAELLREQGVKDDAFFTLAAMLGGDTEATFTVPAKLEPLHLAMMRMARVQITDTAVDAAEVPELRTIAFSPNAELDARLMAAERAEAAGSIEAQSLAQIYGAMNFAPSDIASALTDVDSLSGPRGRALLYHAARAQKVPAARAEVLAKAFVLARAQGRLATAVRVFLPLLEAIRPTEDLAWFAGEAARAFYFTGHLELAGQWATLATEAPPAQATPNAMTARPTASPATAAESRPRLQEGKAAGAEAGASPAVPPRVNLWPYLAIAAAGADRKPATAAAQPDAAASGGGGVPGSNLATLPGPVAMPVAGPTAADALAGARSVERGPNVDLLAKSAVESEALPTTAKAPPGPAFDNAMFERWRKAQVAGGESSAPGREALLLTLLDALGTPVPTSAWMETVGPVRELGALPQPGLMAALEHGAKAHQVGETVLSALAVMGADGPEKLHPSVIGPVVRALSEVGLAREARALALEVAFEVGL